MRLALALSCLTFGAVATPAGAATVHVDTTADPVVYVTDEQREANIVAISYVYGTNNVSGPTTVEVRDDAAPLEAGDGCAATGGRTVRCTVSELGGIIVRLGGGDDAATALPPAEGSCRCVSLWGGDGHDTLTSRDSSNASGESGNDVIVGWQSGPGQSDNRFDGGEGNDKLRAGPGIDEAAGGLGDDIVEGGNGEDTVRGGLLVVPEGVQAPPGRDELNGGGGNDTLDDGDHAGGEIGPDTVIGGTDFDHVASYVEREANVTVDLSDEKANDGEHREGDRLLNVEMLFGGVGDDALIGDGDENIIDGGGGSNRLFGGGGDDVLSARGARKLNFFQGGVGDDVITTETSNPGTMLCGRGHDRVTERTGADAPRPVDEQDPGPLVSPTCEVISRDGDRRWGIDPVPDDAPAGRTLVFPRPEGSRYSRAMELTVTTSRELFTKLGSGVSTRRGIEIRLPADIARRIRRKGMDLRAVVRDMGRFGPDKPVLRNIWRFRVAPG